LRSFSGLPEIRSNGNREMKVRVTVAAAALNFDLNGRIEIQFQCTLVNSIYFYLKLAVEPIKPFAQLDASLML
jgi:hypothetical protein